LLKNENINKPAHSVGKAVIPKYYMYIHPRYSLM
jgi:hypothetical protein